MHNKFFTPTSTRVSARLNEYLKENFGYQLSGEISELRKARTELQEMADRGEGNYVETTLMLHTVDALIKAHAENISESSDKEKEYTCVHAKKGKCEVKATSSYGAAKKAAEKWKLKSTAGIDAHLHTAESKSKPDFLDVDKDGDKKEPMKKAMKDKKGSKMNESLHQRLMRELNSLMESDAANAEVTMAARSIVDDLQDVIEKLGKIQNDQLGPLADEMSYTHGQESAQQFKSSVDGSIDELLQSARSAKEAVNNAVLVLSGDAQPEDTMGGEEVVGGDMSDDFDDDIATDMGDDMNAGPVDEPLGRAKR